MMKKALLVFLFFWVLGFVCYGNDDLPRAISPGIDGGTGIVNNRCPAFSWSGVAWAERYKVVIFLNENNGAKTYEEMSVTALILIQEISGGALSWTPSLEQGLPSGVDYIWYIGAMDAAGNWLWSEGRRFRVEENIGLAVIEEVRTGLKQQGIKDEAIDKVLAGVQPGMSVKKPKDSRGNNPVRPLGTEGSKSTFYGTGAGTNNSSDGNENSFFGSFAGNANTSGNFNTFMGRNAGASNNTGYENTFVGSYAGYANTTGFFNIFMGRNAGYLNTTGNYNTFMGSGAGYYNTTGNYNTFMGSEVGTRNTTGNFNTFMGRNTGYWNTTGYNNTFIGSGAGFSTTTGYENTFMGRNAGASNTTGYQNIFMGMEAGYSNTVGNNNIFLGYKAGYYETGSDKLYIENSDTSSPLIYGDFATNFVKVNGNFQVTGIHSGDFKIAGNLSLDEGTTLINSTEINLLDGKTLATGSTNNDILVTKGYVDENDDVGGGLTGSDMTDTYLCKWDDANTRLVDSLISETSGIVGLNGWLGVGTQIPAYPMELKTTGRNAAFVATRTDGAVNFMNATANNGQFGTINNFPVRILVNSSPKMTLNANNSLTMASGATCTVGGVWQNASSRSLKENIVNLKAEEAVETLKGLNPVRFTYKADKSDEQVGFIAEDVPDLVATKDRKGMSAMDVVAVLTKVVQEQQKSISEQKVLILKQQKTLIALQTKLSEHERKTATEK